MDKFINGFDSWQETHFEIVSEILSRLEQDNSNVAVLYSNSGRGALYLLAESLTSRFEQENEERIWEGDFYDEIESFCKKYLDADTIDL